MFNSLSDFYKSSQWETLVSLLRLSRMNDSGEIICDHCGKPIVKKYDCIGHHVIPLTESNVNDYDVSLSESNVVLVHHKCHNKIHERFGSKPSRHVYLVYGSPCSGKSSYVAEVAGKHDIIVDIDRIYQMISNNSEYVKPKSISQNVFAVRDALIDSIRMRRGWWVNAYIIGGYPFKSERERLSETLGCEEIFIDTPQDVCLVRANDRPSEWVEYINRWFEDHTE